MRNLGERTVAHVADDLGVPTNQLHLRKEVERLKMEKAILKKAAAFFAKEDE